LKKLYQKTDSSSLPMQQAMQEIYISPPEPSCPRYAGMVKKKGSSLPLAFSPDFWYHSENLNLAKSEIRTAQFL
jgi:hypothetical protein